MPNRLADSTSPYLQQHADNPVDWWEWGPEAFNEARRRGVPVFVSIGYSACHWCHVMAHESFEDDATAAFLNDQFVSIKVDREERPDVDAVYMDATTALTGHGGWPMSVFVDHEGRPFYAGTYFPPEPRHGMPSFGQVLASIAESWATRRDDVEGAAQRITHALAARTVPAPEGEAPPSAEILGAAVQSLARSYDERRGGFGRAPKFPPSMVLEFLLRHAARTGNTQALAMVEGTCEAMARGGIYDQIAGGFARYSVDDAWVVPHFEKMLYDNALLARLGVHLWQATGEDAVRTVTERTFDWVRREMTDSAGGWYASLDADSEGHEGRFYVWSMAELEQRLGDDASLAIAYWGVSAAGNFEGANILHVARPLAEVAASLGLDPTDAAARLERCRRVLFDARAPRERPARDEKVLAAWNGLMLRAMAEGAFAFADDGLRDAALANGRFLLDRMMTDGRIHRSWRDGRAMIPGFLEDHAAVGLGFLALHELTGDGAWFDAARQLADATVRWFWDQEAGAFFDTAHDAERLVTRPRDVTDNAMPSGTSLAIELQLLMAERGGDAGARARATHALATLREPMRRSPLAFGHLLGVADRAVHGPPPPPVCGPDGCAPF